VAGSAGNHAQALAYAARATGLRCEVYMPADAAVSKIEAVRAFGAEVDQRGGAVDDCVSLARERAHEAGFVFVHPFDDLDVIAGQAGVGLELLEDVPDLARVVVPVGGGGLASGLAAAIKQQRPEVSIVGVQAEAYAPYARLRHGDGDAAAPSAAPAAVRTIADGIAVKRPGEITLPLLNALLDDVVTVPEDDIAEAMVQLVERSKLVVEGAGAVSLAALLSGAVAPAASGSTVAILSGGNVDVTLLAAVATLHETRVGRRLRVYTRVTDLPGALAGLLSTVAAEGANLIDVAHVRQGVDLGVRETGIELTMETRGPKHAERVLRKLAEAGYEPSDVS
jgi:threonine dehydratase